jgi:hypothetical protein
MCLRVAGPLRIDHLATFPEIAIGKKSASLAVTVDNTTFASAPYWLNRWFVPGISIADDTHQPNRD